LASGSDDLGFWLEIFVAFDVVVVAFEAVAVVADVVVADVVVAVVTEAADAAFVFAVEFAADDHFEFVRDCEPELGQESVELDDVVEPVSVEIPVDEMDVADVVDEGEAWQVWTGQD